MPGRLPLRQRLAEGPELVATFAIVPAPEVVELIGLAGFDAVIIDTEHGAFGNESLGPLILAARAHGLYALVRVRAVEPSLIGAALDAGADGVVVPQIATAAEARMALDAARFAPAGRRGANPYVRAAGYLADASWFEQANAEAATVLMIEGKEGIDALDEILVTPGLDAIFVGPFDLSHALGVPGLVDHPLVLETVEAIVASAQSRGVATAAFAPSPELARRWRDRGVRMVAYGVDTGLILQGLRAAHAAAWDTSASVSREGPA